MGAVDLHLHSTASDGALPPAKLVHKAAAVGLTVIALTDHDSVDGIPEALAAAANHTGLTLIPAVEISTDTESGEVHVLGYFIDYKDDYLREKLRSFRESRRTRGEKMVARLAGLGIVIEWSRVQEIAGEGAIGRPHIAQAMLEKGYIGSPKEAFDKYIGQGGPAYVERDKMTPIEAVELIIRARGLPVLAHPFTVNDPEAIIDALAPAGLAGVEVYYGGSTPEQIAHSLSLAKKHNLIATGGSDFHGWDSAAEITLGSMDVPVSAAADLISLASAHGLSGAK